MPHDNGHEQRCTGAGNVF